jgi:hypothetical protein
MTDRIAAAQEAPVECPTDLDVARIVSNVRATVAEKIGCRVEQINGDEQVRKAFARTEIDDSSCLSVDHDIAAYTPDEAVAKLRQIPGVKDYNAEGPATGESVSFEEQSFETLPEVRPNF